MHQQDLLDSPERHVAYEHVQDFRRIVLAQVAAKVATLETPLAELGRLQVEQQRLDEELERSLRAHLAMVREEIRGSMHHRTDEL